MSQRDAAMYRATSGEMQAFGATPLEALSALMRCLPGDAESPIVIWPYNKGDAFFTDAQQARLQQLKRRQSSLSAEERAELEKLVAAAFDATVVRTQSLPLVKT